MDLEEQYDKIYRYCYFKIRCRETAEDITQETFLRYFDRYAGLTGEKGLACLYTIARNLCVEEYRNSNTMPVCGTDTRENGDPSAEWTERIVLKNAIANLPPQEQELLLLRYANDLPISAVCKAAGLSRFAVYRRTAKALKYLKAELEKGGL